MTDHPITPPPELVEQWVQATESNDCIGAFPTNFEQRICTAAARWGADQELEGSGELGDEELWAIWNKHDGPIPTILRAAIAADRARTARRPKPPSLKELALQGFDDISQFALGELEGTSDYEKYKKIADTICRVLEQLND